MKRGIEREKNGHSMYINTKKVINTLFFAVKMSSVTPINSFILFTLHSLDNYINCQLRKTCTRKRRLERDDCIVVCLCTHGQRESERVNNIGRERQVTLNDRPIKIGSVNPDVVILAFVSEQALLASNISRLLS